MVFVLAEVSESLQVLPNPDELIFGSIAFFLLAVGLMKLVFPKAKHVLAERTRKIQGQLEEAERVKRDADAVLDQYRQQLAGAQVDAQKVIDEAKKAAESVRAEILRKAEQESQAILARARADVSGERERAISELRSSLGDWSIQIASRVIEKELSSVDAHRALVDRAIADLVGTGNGSEN